MTIKKKKKITPTLITRLLQLSGLCRFMINRSPQIQRWLSDRLSLHSLPSVSSQVSTYLCISEGRVGYVEMCFFNQRNWDGNGFLLHICMSRRGGSLSDGHACNTCSALQFPNPTSGLPTGERVTGRHDTRWPQAASPLGAMLALPRAKTLWNATQGSKHGKHFTLWFCTIRQQYFCSV